MNSEVDDNVVALVMAAGIASRFGSDKRRFRLPDGHTLLATTLANVRPVYSRCYLVVRPDDIVLNDLENELATQSVDVIPAPLAARGLGASLGNAFRHLTESVSATSAAVILGDMPWLGANICRQLNRHAGDNRIVMPRQGDRLGHPVLFGHDFWPELARLEAGNGAREVVSRHRDAIHTVEIDDDGIWRDVDRPDDLD